MERPRVAVVLGPVLALLLAGCGGGEEGPATFTLSLPGEAALDGWAQSNGVAVTAGGSPFLGDADGALSGVGARQYFSFALGGIPAGANVVQALLLVNQEGTIGTPFGTHGAVVVEHVDYGTALTGADFTTPVLGSFGAASTGPSPGLRGIDVTGAVLADLALPASRSQFRLRFALLDSDADLLDDYTQFTDTENSITGFGIPPALEIRYTLP